MPANVEPVDMGRVTAEIVLTNNEDNSLANAGVIPRENVRRVHVTGIVDTGSMHMVIPQALATQLGLPITGQATVRYADHRPGTRDIADQLSVEILGRTGTYRAIVEPDRPTVLIGAIALEDMDFIVDCPLQVLMPRDPEHITSTLE